VVALGVATGLLVLLPAAGAVAGGYAALERARPDGMECGLWVLPVLALAGAGAVAGLAAGAGAGWVLALGLFRWANRCGLGEVRDRPPVT
jgi:hypothetical protein